MDRADHDLDLAVELVNTYWVLASPPDRLTDADAYQHILRDAGEDALAGQLQPEDLAELRALRDQIKLVFAAESAASAVGVLDPLLRDAAIPARLAVDDGRVRWEWDTAQRGMPALRARLLTALSAHLIRHGTVRIGVCQADPCTCVYVDRSRARTRRYCCDQCNDRAAATAYRRRNSQSR
ncbi:MAG TPA: ABATE domain-containing protein [Streptosporangiaceae bacterium]|jgi:predicted RNA-binding Zn ribbon-like protein|nr:ABATE domain-containing protein [Streptosporangiaceae bacterium]